MGIKHRQADNVVIAEFSRYVFMAFTLLAFFTAFTQPGAQIHEILPRQIRHIVSGIDAVAVRAVAVAAFGVGPLRDGFVYVAAHAAHIHSMSARAGAGYLYGRRQAGKTQKTQHNDGPKNRRGL